MGTWENAGHFLHQAEVWGDWPKLVKAALRTVGCEETAGLFDEAIELSARMTEYLRASPPREVPPALMKTLLAAEKKLDAKANADVTYGKLAAFVRANRGELFKDYRAKRKRKD
jgi:hypothetical protein